MINSDVLSEQWSEVTPAMLEGACLAANCHPKPCPPEAWLAPLWQATQGDDTALTIEKADIEIISQHFQSQFQQIQGGDYQWPASNEQACLDLATGFLIVWPLIEAAWQAESISAATQAVIGNVHLGLYLVVDERGTLDQMDAAGMNPLPDVAQCIAALPLLIPELVMAAAEVYQGHRAQAVNPYKAVGRNDRCPCDSGKKFKQCCGA
ncbi:YecA family protein [Thaumasiovibrio subtropicus]|uniref:YecA family protein n=1 Tax=Thaumasiovibrio subtropicus TaxID=1891207 RepID=UPI000B3534AF|nr:SEC-C metal-binding domain-containing protein [Thaumasiovibrio subtropicus]